MKKFLLKIGLFTTIQLVILSVVVVTASRSTTHTSYYHAMEDKFDRLQSIAGERLIVVGGSNVAFGIDSQSLSIGIEKQVVNMGLHAGIGLDFYLAMLKDCMKKGDTILLLPEFDLLEGNESSKVKLEMARACPRFIPWLYDSQHAKKAFVDNHGFHLVHDWLLTAIKGRPEESNIYCRKGFNQFGDIVSHHVLGCEMKPELEDSQLTNRNLERTKSYLQRLVRFKKHCAKVGVEILISYPPISKQRFELSQTYLGDLEKLLLENGFHLIGEAEDFVYDKTQFYDSYYHLGQHASRDRSNKLNVAILDEIDAEKRMADASRLHIR